MIAAPDNDLPLFRRTFHPEIPDVFFVGLLQPLGAVMPIAEVQSAWLCDHLAGRYHLPPQAALRADIEAERAAMFKRYVRSKRHTMQVDFDDWMLGHARERKAGEARARAGRRTRPQPVPRGGAARARPGALRLERPASGDIVRRTSPRARSTTTSRTRTRLRALVADAAARRVRVPTAQRHVRVRRGGYRATSSDRRGPDRSPSCAATSRAGWTAATRRVRELGRARVARRSTLPPMRGRRYSARGWTASGRRAMAEREPPGVAGATRFASAGALSASA